MATAGPRVGAGDEHRVARQRDGGDDAGRAAVAAVAGRPASAAGGSAPAARLERRVELGERRRDGVLGLADERDRRRAAAAGAQRRTSRGSTAPFHSLSSSAERRVERAVRGRRLGQPRASPKRHRAGARTPPDSTREAQVLALPHRPRVGQPRRRDEQRHVGVADPERREPLELLGEVEAELVARDDGVDALARDEVLGRQHRAPRAR